MYERQCLYVYYHGIDKLWYCTRLFENIFRVFISPERVEMPLNIVLYEKIHHDLSSIAGLFHAFLQKRIFRKVGFTCILEVMKMRENIVKKYIYSFGLQPEFKLFRTVKTSYSYKFLKPRLSAWLT